MCIIENQLEKETEYFADGSLDEERFYEYSADGKIDTISYANVDGLKMKELANNIQVIAITHLPQVASLANSHYHVSKISDNDSTKTIVKKLNKEEQIQEIAKLLSGDKVTQGALENAKELIKNM